MADISNSKLLQHIEGIQTLKDVLVVLVKTEWNSAIVDELENGCRKIFYECGIHSKTVVVPGAIEIPFAVQRCAALINGCSAFIALGCVIRGDTPHFDYVCQSVTGGITSLNTRLDLPVIFGVLTVDTEAQAKERIGGSHGHKGEEAAITAIKMMILNQKILKGNI